MCVLYSVYLVEGRQAVRVVYSVTELFLSLWYSSLYY
jgi:hypothetical protein